jgi:hypothetical protein
MSLFSRVTFSRRKKLRSNTLWIKSNNQDSFQDEGFQNTVNSKSINRFFFFILSKISEISSTDERDEMKFVYPIF